LLPRNKHKCSISPATCSKRNSKKHKGKTSVRASCEEQGIKEWKNSEKTQIRCKSDKAAYHFSCTTRTGIHVLCTELDNFHVMADSLDKRRPWNAAYLIIELADLDGIR
jgi:hypothetical protein